MHFRRMFSQLTLCFILQREHNRTVAYFLSEYRVYSPWTQLVPLRIADITDLTAEWICIRNILKKYHILDSANLSV